MIKLIIVDDNDLLRNSLKEFFKKFDNIQLLFDACNGQHLLSYLHTCKNLPDIILMDLQMPVLDGRLASIKVHEDYPSIKIVIISLYHHEHLVFELLKNGVKGFVTKNIEADELINAILIVYNNEFYVESGINSNSNTLSKSQIETQNNFILSEQQKMFLKLCCQDYTYKEIAEIMNIGVRTVHDHRDRLCERLNINTRIGLIMYAIQMGVVNIWELPKNSKKIDQPERSF